MPTLWLDDIRQPWTQGFMGADWVKTADECIEALKTGKYSFASLDHDLSEEATMGYPKEGEKTGYTVVLFLDNNPQYWPVDGVRVHSLNPVGRDRMLQVIRAHYGHNFL